MLWALVAGVVLGLLARSIVPVESLTWFVDTVAHPLGQVFLRLLFMLVIPILFAALVIGVSEIGVGHLGRLGGRMLGYTILVSGISVLIGVLLVNVIGPGRNLPDEVRAAAVGVDAPATIKPPATSPVDFLIGMVPDNVVKAAANGDMLAMIVFSLLFGLALAVTRTEAVATLKIGIQGLYDVTMTLIAGVLRWVAPIGVAALLFSLTTRLGAAVFLPDPRLRQRRPARPGDPHVRRLLALGPLLRRHVAASSSSAACGWRCSPRSPPRRRARRCRARSRSPRRTSSSRRTSPASCSPPARR